MDVRLDDGRFNALTVNVRRVSFVGLLHLDLALNTIHF